MKRHYLIALLVLALCSYAANDLFKVHFGTESKPEAAYTATPKQASAKAIAPPPPVGLQEANTPEPPASEPDIPNSLPETDKADPSDEVTMIDAPTANKTGAANLSFPIK